MLHFHCLLVHLPGAISNRIQNIMNNKKVQTVFEIGTEI